LSIIASTSAPIRSLRWSAGIGRRPMGWAATLSTRCRISRPRRRRVQIRRLVVWMSCDRLIAKAIIADRQPLCRGPHVLRRQLARCVIHLPSHARVVAGRILRA